MKIYRSEQIYSNQFLWWQISFSGIPLKANALFLLKRLSFIASLLCSEKTCVFGWNALSNSIHTIKSPESMQSHSFTGDSTRLMICVLLSIQMDCQQSVLHRLISNILVFSSQFVLCLLNRLEKFRCHFHFHFQVYESNGLQIKRTHILRDLLMKVDDEDKNSWIPVFVCVMISCCIEV